VFAAVGHAIKKGDWQVEIDGSNENHLYTSWKVHIDFIAQKYYFF